ncbi:sodium/calcium exchanger 1-like isoform X2 [Penaeus chinensis]|uniref:sodium/calcium exchanger 1-like isoform X2 n=1 Tax=Penaeus chinensis TaxID=139456 RepID=UPI001FB6C8BB|nr:sodium/calcium exchanger 1-like isoform X2 [Penaeus chinensis]
MFEHRSSGSSHWGMKMLGLCVLVLAFCSPVSASEDNSTVFEKCVDGLIIPVWTPQEGLSTGDRVARAIVYFVAMVWLFIGVSIVSDRFMGSIEMITSQEKEVTVKKPNGETQIIVVQVWNETVANLTLMALGSSAPEILLSVIEIYARNFEAGDLGPGTIVGSAAFNLFVIISICVYVIPDGEVRYIKHLRVFFITSFFSVFAYIWLYVILAHSSYGVVEFWEAFLTFLFFPITVILAYIADRRLLFYKYMSKEYRLNRRGVIVEVEGRGDVEMGKTDEGPALGENVDESIKEFEEHRKEYMAIIRELRQKHPNAGMETLEGMAREEIINRGPKSRAFYRIQATRKLTGGGNIMKKVREEAKQEKEEEIEEKKDDETIRVFFDPGHYTVMENVGTFQVTVVREGGDLNTTVLVDYKTEDGTANAGGDYVGAEGTLVFLPGETQKSFSLEVIDDEVFEEDEHFYVRLSNMRLGSPDGTAVTHAVNGAAGQPNKPVKMELSAPYVATIMILDDDHGGIFNVGEKDVEIVESIGTYELKIVRWSGARGRVSVPFKTEDGTAKAGKDYEECEGELVFENNETEKTVSISIIEEDSYEKDVLFYVDIGEPQAIGDIEFDIGFEFANKESDLTEEEKIALLGKPKLGNSTRTQIRVKENKEYKNMVDKLVKKANASLLVGTSSWKEQFSEAITVQPDEEGDEEEETEKLPSCMDYVMHFVTVFWKILFAFIPPTDIAKGYPTFIISILGIGLLTAFIGDFASHFGCSIGLKDSVTAIAFVALGTSVPDTFASKVAAQQDPYADASVGNVTGSNAVNVFLGIGIAWTLAAIYHNVQGRDFEVLPGNLAFSVTLFCVEAAVAIMVMMIRRHPSVGGELGGPRIPKIVTSAFLAFLWVFYVFMSSLEAYDIIPSL